MRVVHYHYVSVGNIMFWMFVLTTLCVKLDHCVIWKGDLANKAHAHCAWLIANATTNKNTAIKKLESEEASIQLKNTTDINNAYKSYVDGVNAGGCSDALNSAFGQTDVIRVIIMSIAIVTSCCVFCHVVPPGFELYPASYALVGRVQRARAAINVTHQTQPLKTTTVYAMLWGRPTFWTQCAASTDWKDCTFGLYNMRAIQCCLPYTTTEEFENLDCPWYAIVGKWQCLLLATSVFLVYAYITELSQPDLITYGPHCTLVCVTMVFLRRKK